MLFASIILASLVLAMIAGVPAGIVAGVRSFRQPVTTGAAFLHGFRIVLFIFGVFALIAAAVWISAFWNASAERLAFGKTTSLQRDSILESLIFFVLVPALVWVPFTLAYSASRGRHLF